MNLTEDLEVESETLAVDGDLNLLWWRLVGIFSESRHVYPPLGGIMNTQKVYH